MHSNRLLLNVFVAALALMWITAACALSKDDIINMKSVGVPDSIIISTIQSSDAVFNLSAEDIIELKKGGISDTVIEAMQSTSGGVDRESRRVVEEPPPREEVRSSSRDDDEEDDGGREERSSTRSRSTDDDEEDDDMIRGRRTRRDEGEDDRDERGEAKALAYTPPEIKEAIGQYKSKKYLSSSYNLYNILDSRKYPEQDVKIYYYLADSLYKMELYHSAQVYFIKVVGQGSGTYFAPALTKLVYIWRKTNDPTALVQLIGEVNPEDFPSKVRSDLMYLLGRRQFDEQNYRQALRHLEQVSDRSDHYIQAQYVQGVIYNRQGKLKRATGRFTDILRETTIYGDPAEIERVKHLSMLNIGRVHYAREQYGMAAEYYDTVPRKSEQRLRAEYERTWADLAAVRSGDTTYIQEKGHPRQRDRLKRVHATLDRLENAEQRHEIWEPGIRLLRVEYYRQSCEYDLALEGLDQLEEKFGSAVEEVKAFIKPYADRELAPEHAYESLYGLSVYEAYYGASRTPTKRRAHDEVGGTTVAWTMAGTVSLPQIRSRTNWPTCVLPAQFAHIEADHTLLGPHHHVCWIEREIELVHATKPQWKSSPIGQALVDRLREDRLRYMKRAGIVLVNQLNDDRKSYEGVMAQAALYRADLLDASYRRFKLDEERGYYLETPQTVCPE